MRTYCDIECQVDRALISMGYRRSFFSQKGQDRWLIRRIFGGRRGGYFVDVGAGNGVTHSNTFALERDFGWTGILVEANQKYAAEIGQKRRGLCFNVCVDSEVKEVDFLCYGYLGGVIRDDADNAPLKRGNIIRRNVNNILRIPSVRLYDVLAAAGAPPEIDYLSIDVEGAEEGVLRGMSFTDYTVKVITIERPTKVIHELLVNAGFVLAKYWLWDGFYLSQSLAKELVIASRPFAGACSKSF